jgi:hypothetical protein
MALLCGAAIAAPAAPAAAPPASGIPQVTVEAQREAIAEQARRYVGKVSGSGWATAVDRPLGLWRRPVCLAVAGLTRPEGEFVFRRLTGIITSAGAPVGDNACSPNLLVVFTTEPEALLSAWRKRNKRLFGAANPGLVNDFIRRPLPVRVWYNTSFTGENGEQGTPSSSLSSGATGAGPGTTTLTQMMLLDIPTYPEEPGGTRLSLTAVPDLSSAIAVVDLKQCEGSGWGALTDYIAMASLSKLDLATSFRELPSVLALFGAPGEGRQTGLTDWDRAYLKALYHTRRMSRLQRVEMREQMAREMDAMVTGTP